MIDLSRYYDFLKTEGVEFISGVPDTLLNDFCLGLDDNWAGSHHVIAANEGNSIALAGGYHLASGTVPLVYMQNSGLGNTLNPLISLADPLVYSIPMVMLIGWRGDPQTNDWPQHKRQGELTPVLLESLNIAYRVLEGSQDEVEDATRWAIQTARQTQAPTALLVRKGVMAKKEKAPFAPEGQQYSLSREAAITSILQASPENTVFVASTGRITRELHAVRELLDQPHSSDFLNVGAMGHALSIAAGIASAKPERKVVCLDGDAAALMHMGSMPITANRPLSNLTHIVLNNGVHESVGGQTSVGFTANLNAIARAAGYGTLNSFLTQGEEIARELPQVFEASQPTFIEVRIRKGMRSDMPLLKIDPHEQKEALQQQLKNR